MEMRLWGEPGEIRGPENKGFWKHHWSKSNKHRQFGMKMKKVKRCWENMTVPFSNSTPQGVWLKLETPLWEVS